MLLTFFSHHRFGDKSKEIDKGSSIRPLNERTSSFFKVRSVLETSFWNELQQKTDADPEWTRSWLSSFWNARSTTDFSQSRLFCCCQNAVWSFEHLMRSEMLSFFINSRAYLSRASRQGMPKHERLLTRTHLPRRQMHLVGQVRYGIHAWWRTDRQTDRQTTCVLVGRPSSLNLCNQTTTWTREKGDVGSLSSEREREILKRDSSRTCWRRERTWYVYSSYVFQPASFERMIERG